MREPESAAERTERLVCALPGCDEFIPMRGDGLHLYHSTECRDEARRLGLGPDSPGESVLEELPRLRVDKPPALRRGYRGVAALVAGVGLVGIAGTTIMAWPEGEEYRLAPIAQEGQQQPVTDSYDTGTLLPEPLLPPSDGEPDRIRPQDQPPAAPPPEAAPPPVETTTSQPRTVKRSPAPYVPSVRYTFDRGFQGWEVFWDEGNLGVEAPSGPTFAGPGALMMRIVGGGFAAVGVDSTAIPSSATVTYYVYSDGSGNGHVQPIVFDQANRPYLPTGEIRLPARKGYFRVSFTTPAVPIAAIGLEVFSEARALLVGIDSVTW